MNHTTVSYKMYTIRDRTLLEDVEVSLVWQDARNTTIIAKSAPLNEAHSVKHVTHNTSTSAGEIVSII